MHTKKALRGAQRLGAINAGPVVAYGLLTLMRMNSGLPEDAVHGSLY